VRGLPQIFRSNETLTSFALLVLITGVGLVFSMPSATFVYEILQSPLSRGTPAAFLVVYVLSFVFFGVNRGAAGIPLEHWSPRSLARALVNLLVGLLLTAPYLVYIRIILLPLDRIVILWIGAYSLLVATSFALLAQWLEVRGTRLGRDTAVLRYAIAAGFVAVPMAFHFAPQGVRLLSLLSPLSGVIRLYAGAASTEMAVLFAAPVAGCLVLLWLIRRETRWSSVRV